MASMKRRLRVSNYEDDSITNSDNSFSDTDENKKLIYYKRENDKDDEKRSKVSTSVRNYLKKTKIFIVVNKVKINYLKRPKLLIALFLFAIVAYVFYSINVNEEELYKRGFHDLKVSFKLEDQLSWKLLDNSLSKQLFKKTEFLERPSVILLVGTKEKSESFLMRLENLISVRSQCRSWQPLKVDHQEEQLKSSMLGFMNETYKDGVHCAKMGNISQIPPALGPILHGLTDEKNALYKDMIYLFSLVVGDGHRNDDDDDDDDGQSMNMKKLNEMFVVDVLRRYWVLEMGEERFQALINRLAGTVIGIK